MDRIRLIHWNAAEGEERAARLRKAGHSIEFETRPDPTLLRRLRDDPPSAVVIDLERLPSHGRDVGVALRQYKSTRHVPLVFAGGAPEKVARVRKLLPDAVFTPWSRIRGALRRALAHPPADPVVPGSVMAGYAGRPLAAKLGIKPDQVVGLIGAPEGIERTLGRLPEGATLRRGARGRCDLLIWFTRSRAELGRRVDRVAARLESGAVWIAWPKKGSALAADLTQGEVRRAGLAAGLVDYKICAIDETWSGLLFTRRRAG
jgi:hypothetical protein